MTAFNNNDNDNNDEKSTHHETWCMLPYKKEMVYSCKILSVHVKKVELSYSGAKNQLLSLS